MSYIFSTICSVRTISFVLLLALTTIQLAHTFHCYQCNSRIHKDCEAITENSAVYLKECNETYTVFTGNKIECSANSTEDTCQHIENELKAKNCTGNGSPEGKECDQLKQKFFYDETMQEDRNFTLCRKIVTRIHETYVTKHGDKEVKTTLVKPRISRQCGYERDDDHDDSCIRKGSLATTQITCSCAKERCNGANRKRNSYAITSGITFSLYIFLFT